MPLKQNGVKRLIDQHQVSVMAILESKLNSHKLLKVMSRKFPGWEEINNFQEHPAGRIVVLWDPLKIRLEPLGIFPQVIHCLIRCKISGCSFQASFVYAFNSVLGRRSLWQNLTDFGASCSVPWTVMGDFNCVLNASEKINGADITPYETEGLSDCCLSTGLTDLASLGCFFTWTNNSVCSKLDRVLINQYWASSNLLGHAKFLPAGCLSDHSPYIVSFLQQRSPQNKPFRFFNMWSDHTDFLSTVSSVFHQHIPGSKQFSFCKKLKQLKAPLKRLNVKHFSHISTRVLKADKELEEAQISLNAHPQDQALQARIAMMRKHSLFLKEAERSFYQQQAKCNYLHLSDKCTKFFHAIVKRNSKRNFIAAISRADGSVTSSTEEVAGEFIHFFEGLLGSSKTCEAINPHILCSGPSISAAQAAFLSSNISNDEIKSALFSIGDEKAPGPDGFSACFFKKAWPIIGDQFSEAIHEFFSSGSLLKQINHSLIVLVPKTKLANSVGDYRPIACCSVVYKVISKILASRLASVLDSIIDGAQSAFVKGRSLMENVHLAQELLRNFSRKRISPRCLIKVDLRKAFDSVNWEFLQQILEGLGFPSVFSQWVMECIGTASYSIMINGGLHGFFKGQQGLRQGDPLSPFLFVLCIEYFSRTLNLATAGSDFNYHPKCISLGISHLAFADDLMLFARGDVVSIRILMDCLRNFEAASGLSANALKSNIYPAGIIESDLNVMLADSRFSIGELPFRYLGIPLAAEQLKVIHYGPLLDKISDSIKAWTASSLSYAGRLELIRAVLQGIECFWLSILPAPAAILEKIYRLCRHFLWNSKAALVAWQEVCLPKHEGGLGLKDLQSWNSALLAKVLWNIHRKKDSLWVRWVHQRFLASSSIWELRAKRDDSPLIKKILGLRDTLCAAQGSPANAIQLLSRWTRGESLNISLAYNFFRPKARHRAWAPVVWHSCITPKHSFILWLCAKERLLTKDKIHFMELNRSCLFCGATEESLHHLYFQCPLSSRVWSSIKAWVGLSRSMSSLPSALKWLKKETRGNSWFSKFKRIAFSSTVYQIWTARNRFIFEGLPAIAECIIHRIKTSVYRAMFALYPQALVQLEALAIDR